MMRWFILFTVSWVVFFLLKGWKNFRANFWCGIWAVAVQVIVDDLAEALGLYKILGGPVVLNSSIFFTFGPVFVVGVLIAEYYPRTPWLNIMSIAVLTVLYSFVELVIVYSGNVVYINWNIWMSIFINFTAMILIHWFAAAVLRKGIDAS